MKTSRLTALTEWGKAHWATLRTVLTTVFLILIVFLIGMAAWHVEWDEVLQAMVKVPVRTLALGGLLTLASYLVYATFDLIGKRYAGHKLSSLTTYLSGMMVYAFIMSLGSSVGGLGLRLRLYTQRGVSTGKATRVFGLAVVTNWMGYLLIAGIVFALGALSLPSDWWLGTGALRIAGTVMVLISIAYVLLCFFPAHEHGLFAGSDWSCLLVPCHWPSCYLQRETGRSWAQCCGCCFNRGQIILWCSGPCCSAPSPG